MNLFYFLLSAALTTQVSVADKLVNFQVAQPPPVPQAAKQCTIQILQRDFAFSYGHPEIVQFNPPTDCGEPGSWAAITLNFTVTSNGTQYDRLGTFTFQNVEIWRTSTPEPSPGDGIIWTYIKDVTRYMPLFSIQGPFILELDNVVQANLDGIYSSILHATFYASSSDHPPAPKADLILPISNLRNDTGNQVSVPPAFSLNITFPRNVIKVFAEIYASGNGNEEFWYYNTANQYLPSLPAGFLGQGPFREVRLLIDGRVSGVAYPYATIFTGGVVPSSWRPITAYGALDLPTYFVDVTPFVPILSDGNPHNFTLDVVSAETDQVILQNWYLSGNLQVYVDKSSLPTTGNLTKYEVQPFSETTISGSVNGSDVNITVSALRQIHIESVIIGGSGVIDHVVFDQQLEYKNVQTYSDNVNIQNVAQVASGSISSTHSGQTYLSDQFSYPFAINLTYLDANGSSWKALFDHSYDRQLLPLPNSVKSVIANHQTASGYFFVRSNGNFGNGTNNNVFSYTDDAGNSYYRNVNAALDKITLDWQGGTLSAGAEAPSTPSPESSGGGERQAGLMRLPHGSKG